MIEFHLKKGFKFSNCSQMNLFGCFQELNKHGTKNLREIKTRGNPTVPFLRNEGNESLLAKKILELPNFE